MNVWVVSVADDGYHEHFENVFAEEMLAEKYANERNKEISQDRPYDAKAARRPGGSIGDYCTIEKVEVIES